MKDFFHK